MDSTRGLLRDGDVIFVEGEMSFVGGDNDNCAGVFCAMTSNALDGGDFVRGEASLDVRIPLAVGFRGDGSTSGSSNARKLRT